MDIEQAKLEIDVYIAKLNNILIKLLTGTTQGDSYLS